MKKVHVCLVSDQPIPTLTTVRQFKPDKVILLYTSDMQRQKDRLSGVLRGWKYTVEAIQILPYDLGNVIDASEKLISDHVGDEISLNITGGTKIGTMGSFQAFYSSGLPIFYVNTRDDQILQVSPQDSVIPINAHIPLADYLAAYGFTVTSYGKDDAAIEQRSKAGRALREMVSKEEWKLGRINKAIPDDFEYSRYPLAFAPDIPDFTIHTPSLIEAGILLQHGEGWQIPSLEAAKFLKGFWFEELVYLTAKQTGADEVRRNVEGRWDVPGAYTPTNEFDVMIAKGTRLFLVSCKTSNPNRTDGSGDGVGKEYLYELDALGDRALGLFGKKMLVSARAVTNDYIRKRAQSMGIAILDKTDLHRMKEKLTEWLNR